MLCQICKEDAHYRVEWMGDPKDLRWLCENCAEIMRKIPRPLKVQQPLPLIDGHCHIQGKSLQKPTSVVRASHKARVKASAELKEAEPDLEETGHSHWGLADWRMVQWAFDEEDKIAEKALRSANKFIRESAGKLYREKTKEWPIAGPPKPRVAIMPMMMDFGYTPVSGKMGKAAYTKTTSKYGYESNRGHEFLYFAKDRGSDYEKNYLWYPRDRNNFDLTIRAISAVAKKYPGRIWPFVPFDPRRPNALDMVKDAIEKKGFVGVKTYTRTGWMPLDNWALHGEKVGETLDKRLRELYEYAQQNQIPILNHTSPTGYPKDIVYPWRLTEQADPEELCNTDGKSLPNHVYFPPVSWIDPARFKVKRSGDQKAYENAQYHARKLAIYCYYVQLTTSPYAWVPVLEKFPKLRLCLAHAGSDLSTYVHYMLKGIKKCDKGLLENPLVVPGKDFKRFFKKAVKKHIRAKFVLSSTQQNACNQLFEEDAWARWFGRWESTYKDDWFAKIKDLFRYENLYTDLAYITGDAKAFKQIVEPIVNETLNLLEKYPLLERINLGTDWYMTEMNKLTPRKYWKLFYDAIRPNTQLLEEIWHHWATYNNLRFVNLPGAAGNGMERLETFYGKKKRLPIWWDEVKKFYERDWPKRDPAQKYAGRRRRALSEFGPEVAPRPSPATAPRIPARRRAASQPRLSSSPKGQYQAQVFQKAKEKKLAEADRKLIMDRVGKIKQLSKYDYAFVPVNNARDIGRYGTAGTHWSLLLWCIRHSTAFHYDSLNQSNEGFAQIAAKRLGVKLKLQPSPTQKSGSNDCGLYLMWMTEWLARDLEQKKFAVSPGRPPAIARPDDMRQTVKRWIQTLGQKEEKGGAIQVMNIPLNVKEDVGSLNKGRMITDAVIAVKYKDLSVQHQRALYFTDPAVARLLTSEAYLVGLDGIVKELIQEGVAEEKKKEEKKK